MTRFPLQIGVVATALLAVAGCNTVSPGACAGLPGTAQLTAQLYLGGDVDTAAWQRFLDSDVTPRFPDGLTVLAAEGQWRTPGGRQIQEHSRVLLIVMPRSPDAIGRVEAVATAYKTRFAQISVGVVFSEGCAAF